EPHAALLLCSDGLTDVIDSSSVTHIVDRFAGRADRVAKELIAATNAAGGKDNVSVVYVEGEQFASDHRASAAAADDITRRLGTNGLREAAGPDENRPSRSNRRPTRRTAARAALITLLVGVTATAAMLYRQR